MRVAIAQINPTVGDVEANAGKVADAIARAQRESADLLLVPELVICGYPPRDLLLLEGFVEACERAVRDLAGRVRQVCALVGSPRRKGESICNSLFALRRGEVEAVYDKRLLPTYDVFDEDRYFTAGERAVVIDVAGVKVGLSVCEDLWRGVDAGTASRYAHRPDPIEALAQAGAQLIVNPSASPFAVSKVSAQRRALSETARQRDVVVAAVNQVGANDELIFAGSAALCVPDPTLAAGARLVAAGAPFTEDFIAIDLPADPAARRALPAVEDPLLSMPRAEQLWRALTLGVRDYCAKTGFRSVALGLSGGVDSAVVACVAAGALGPERVLAVAMPSRFSSKGSVADAQALAAALRVRLELAPIEPVHAAAETTLAPLFGALAAGAAAGAAEENVQARIRGLILMAISNKTGAILLTTGNKSELAVGYCTLYGDMNGGLAVLADVLKTQVYELARWINAHPGACGFSRPPIPESILTKPPSAELKPDQTDQDALPPYETLDAVVERLVESRWSLTRIARETGVDAQTVERIACMVDLSEYKRRQLAVGLKVTPVAFGTGRRMPIAQRWRQRAESQG